jgi:hypothetical protein
MIELHEWAIIVFALFPLITLLCIWCIEYVSKKLMLAGAWALGSLALFIMGRP